MRIRRKSIIDGVVRVMDLDVTQEQLAQYEYGAYIQDAFPHLTMQEREFIKTGITPTQWIEVFGERPK